MEKMTMPTAANETLPPSELLRQQVEALREDLAQFVGENLTGETLQEADAIALELQQAETALRQAEQAVRLDRNAMPAEPPAEYPGSPRIVNPAEAQFRAPALEQQVSVADLASANQT